MYCLPVVERVRIAQYKKGGVVAPIAYEIRHQHQFLFLDRYGGVILYGLHAAEKIATHNHEPRPRYRSGCSGCDLLHDVNEGRLQGAAA